MWRKSSLTDAQWEQIGKRLLTGKESARALAREFGTSETSLRRKFPAQRKDVKDVAKQLLEADQALKSLPIASQIDAITLYDEMKAGSMHMASAFKFNAASTHRLSMWANQSLEKVDIEDFDGSVEHLKKSALLQGMANKASEMPINFMKATKGEGAQEADPPAPVQIIIGVEDASKNGSGV